MERETFLLVANMFFCTELLDRKCPILQISKILQSVIKVTERRTKIAILSKNTFYFSCKKRRYFSETCVILEKNTFTRETNFT